MKEKKNFNLSLRFKGVIFPIVLIYVLFFMDKSHVHIEYGGFFTYFIVTLLSMLLALEIVLAARKISGKKKKDQ